MVRTLDIVLIAVMISAAAWTYKIKHDAQAIETEVNRLEKKIALQKETIQLLQADWTLLDQPGRLEDLVSAFADDLQLKPLQPNQIVEPDELPARPVGIDHDPSRKLGGYADNSHTMVR
ncbi:hypothetical protein [Aurantimonas sp. VKM B-3413]|uniref:cell division protein FtsL n=1 Tax=Aurantimonas sp. VKM B-3413 TaxID=2779401 RepID=UPI001E34B712|nr:hypothetical protein [Aurantimonas sp. VKM B-3413]MCB8837866.1 hypothetical protein [Aurantimonas sp. VKM B-3413]